MKAITNEHDWRNHIHAFKRLAVFILLPMFLLSACDAEDSSNFSINQLDSALTEVSAERTHFTGLPQATLQSTIESSVQASPVPSVTSLISPSDPHNDGTYLVGTEIAVGLWRSLSSEQRFCYWARRKYDGILLGSYYGLPGTEMRIYEIDYEVELDGCGTWIFMGAN